jgi:SAM-dependent methyltransferase
LSSIARSHSEAQMSRFLNGDALYGDDLDATDIEAWYAEETEGYASMDYSDAQGAVYHYHALNRHHGFDKLPKNIRFGSALGIGSAFAEEFAPVATRIDRLTVLDPSDRFPRDRVHGIATRYVKPQASGIMPFDANSFDLITCFGTLHHVPNVSKVMHEISRVVKPGGHVLIREPIISMGDWRLPRPGLTRHERGIPFPLFERMVGTTDLRIVDQALVGFGPLSKLARVTKRGVFDSPVLTSLDAWLCRLSARNTTYHRQGLLQKFGPNNAFWVLKKP